MDGHIKGISHRDELLKLLFRIHKHIHMQTVVSER